jgi:hypothetical protein
MAVPRSASTAHEFYAARRPGGHRAALLSHSRNYYYYYAPCLDMTISDTVPVTDVAVAVRHALQSSSTAVSGFMPLRNPRQPNP